MGAGGIDNFHTQGRLCSEGKTNFYSAWYCVHNKIEQWLTVVHIVALIAYKMLGSLLSDFIRPHTHTYYIFLGRSCSHVVVNSAVRSGDSYKTKNTDNGKAKA